jgi:hypothetical protein
MSERASNRGHVPAVRVCVLSVAFVAIAVGVGGAQTPSTLPGRLRVGAGVGWLAGAEIAAQPADLRSASGSSYRLFQSETELVATPTFDARIGFALTRRYEVEGRAAINRPELRTVVSSDAEATGSFTITENIDEYVFDGGIVVHLNELKAIGLVPFAMGGAGYIRRLHDRQSLVEEGHLYYVGGGVTRALFARSQGFVRGASVRADLRLNVFSTELDDDSHLQGSASGVFIVAF